MLDRLDRLSARAFGRALQLLCWATGKSNFFFARVAAVTAMVWWYLIVVLWVTIPASMPKGSGLTVTLTLPSWLLLPLAVVGVVWLCYLPIECRQTWQQIKILEHYSKVIQESGLMIGPTDAAVFSRLIDLSLGIMSPLNSLCAYWLWRSAAHYWMWDFQPPRKGRLRKQLQRLRESLSVTAPRSLPSPA